MKTLSSRGGKELQISKSDFPRREIVFQLQKVVSRDGKPFSDFKKPFPATGNRFSISKSDFPRRETVFRFQKAISRGGKPFFNFKKPFPAAGRRSRFSPHPLAGREVEQINCHAQSFLCDDDREEVETPFGRASLHLMLLSIACSTLLRFYRRA